MSPFGRRRRSPFERRPDGNYSVELDDGTRSVLEALSGQLRELLSTDSPALTRLFPPPYGDDEERNQGYSALAGAELVEGRLSALDTMQAGIHATELTPDELQAWMRTVNDLRLVLGTTLGLEDESGRPADADEQMYDVYEYLGAVLESIVQALAS